MDKCALLERICANFPHELQALDQWVTWRLEERTDRQGQVKLTKVPYNAMTGQRARSDNPGTWASFAQAGNNFLHDNYNGIGFMFSMFDPYCGIDFDNCVSNRIITNTVKAQYVKRLDSYSEFSQSGHGVHVITAAQLPGQGRNDQKRGREMYDKLRFFVVTGDHVPGTPRNINARQTEVAKLYHELFPVVAKVQPSHRQQAQGIPADDQELLQRMFASKNGATIEALWQGNLTGYGSQSEADIALCGYLAFWTGNDTARIDQLFRQSGLYRDKWDRNARQGETYGTGTVERALVAKPYTGRRQVTVRVQAMVVTG